MPDWVSEHVGEILVLVYIFYPLLKRWWERAKRKQEERRGRREEQSEGQSQRQRQPQRQPQGQSQRQRQPQGQSQRQQQGPGQRQGQREQQAGREENRDRASAPSQGDIVSAARARVARLEQKSGRLLERAERDPKLARLVPALREDLLGRIDEVKRALGGAPTISTVIQETAVIEALEQLLRYMATMAQQRSYDRSSFLDDADTLADACYAPILELARAQGLKLKTSEPVSVSGDWELSIVPRFASTRVAPLRLPAGFERSLWLWPAIAHEVAHDFFYSLDSIERELYTRLGLPRSVDVPGSERELDPGWLRRLFGAWLPEIFADLLGTLMLGPAYVETMRRAFGNPGSPQRTAAILQDGGRIDAHPPERLRVYMATQVLHHLGRHEEADEIWERWESDHPGVAFYFLPLGGEWVGLSDEALHGVAGSIVETLLQRPWPELAGFRLLNIPGLAYLHAEHAEVERLMKPLAEGERVHADPRWIVAASVLAAMAQPTLHDTILEAARLSIQGMSEAPTGPTPTRRRPPTHAIAPELRASLSHPPSIQEAIILGAALTRGQAPPLTPPPVRPLRPRTAKTR